MAEVTIETKINTAEAAKGLKDLRKALKDLVSAQSEVGAGTAEFKRLQQAINETDSKLGDLNDAFGTLRGTGVDRLSNSLSLLKDAFETASPEKLNIAMQGLGAAMKAIPIFLLIEGAKILFEKWGELSERFSSSAQAAHENEQALKDLTFEIDAQKVAIDRNVIALDAQLAALKRQGAPLDQIISKIREINGLKADALTGELQKVDKEIGNVLAKLKEVKDDNANQSVTESLLQFFGFSAGTTDKEVKAVEEELGKLLLKRGEVDNKRIANETDVEVVISDLNKAASDKRIADFQKFLADKNALNDQFVIDSAVADQKLREAETQLAIDQIKIETDKEKAIRDFEDKSLKAGIEAARKALAEKELAEQKALQDKIKREQVSFQATAQGVAAVQGLTDLAFQLKSNKMQKDSQESIDLAKKQFNVNKALQIANATIMGTQAVLAAYASGVATPVIGPITGAAFAVTAGIIAAANIAKIAATKFEGGSASSAPDSSSSPSIPTPGSGTGPGNSPSPASTFNPQAIQTNPADRRVYVFESDIARIQRKVAVIENQSTFP